MLLAQASSNDVCGTGMDASLLCLLVRRYTDDDLSLGVARFAGVGLRIVLILVVAFVLTRVARLLLRRFGATMERKIEARLAHNEKLGYDAKRYRSRRFQRLQATLGVTRGAAGVVIWFTAVLLVVDALGISMQPILAGAGLAGIVLGFGAQQLVRDVLAGMAMLIEDQYGVGDWIDVNGVIGRVEKVGLRATSFRDLDGVLHHVLNGHVQQVGNLSQEWSRSILDIPIALDADVPTVKAILLKVATDLSQGPVWGQDIISAPEVWGVQEFGPEGLAVRVSMATKPMANWDINRQMRERLQYAFEQAGIRMPGQLVDLGGRPSTGHPVRGHVVTDPDEALRHREGPGAPGRAEDDRPPTTPTDAGEHPDLEGLEAPAPDMTTELRLNRRRERRPD